MKKYYTLIVSFLILSFAAITGFECTSTELTSARLYISQKNYEKAKEVLFKDVSKNPKSDEGYYWLGYIYGEQDSAEKMLDYYNKSLGVSSKFEKEIKPAKHNAWVSSFNRGCDYFTKSFNSTPDSSSIYLVKSKTAFNLSATIDPDYSATYKNLSQVAFKMGNKDEALSYIEKFVKLEYSKLDVVQNCVKIETGLADDAMIKCYGNPDALLDTLYDNKPVKRYAY